MIVSYLALILIVCANLQFVDSFYIVCKRNTGRCLYAIPWCACPSSLLKYNVWGQNSKICETTDNDNWNFDNWCQGNGGDVHTAKYPGDIDELCTSWRSGITKQIVKSSGRDHIDRNKRRSK
ncbi:hypothetical protein MVEG_10360 [Podila verticillata NRRL 6337]|nr:hypothetical protein MVEG_10360 [Podila verticillata NRRL 6337]